MEASDLDDEAALQIAVKSGNDSIDPDGLVPTLLVHGVLPRFGLPTDMQSPSMYQRAAAPRRATEAMTKYFAKNQVSTSIYTRNGPDTSDIHTVPIDSHVLVYHPELDRREGPVTLLAINGESCTVLIPPPSGPKNFRSTVVKGYLTDDNTVYLETNSGSNMLKVSNDAGNVLTLNIKSSDEHKNHRENQITVTSYLAKKVPQSSDHKKYAALRRKEIDGLIKRGVFSPANVDETHGHRIHVSRFED